MRVGLSLEFLGSEALTWYDLLAFVKHIQTRHESALARELHGEFWSMEAQLLAHAVDALNSGNWQRAGRRSSPRPKPIPRPWEKPKTATLGKAPIPISQFNDWWDNHAPKVLRRGHAKKPPTAN